jgi:formylglycine-generating enzyme required for sulfatase activity
MAGHVTGGAPHGWSTGVDSTGYWAAEPTSGARFRTLPAGTYQIGLSDEELAAAKRIEEPNLTVEELRPVITVTLPTLLVAELPIPVDLAARFGFRAEGEDREPGEPAMLTHAEATKVADGLGCRLPSEAEWETMCRAGASTLFPWGWGLPPDDELEQWLAWDAAASTRNAWGFGGLFFGEWCADRYRPSHDSGEQEQHGARVIKGGGSQFWPWQDCGEWVWCMPAARMPSTDLDVDGRCAARLVFGASSEQ